MSAKREGSVSARREGSVLAKREGSVTVTREASAPAEREGPRKPQRPERWQGSDQALRAVQVAFDVSEAVMEAVRVAAFHDNVSTSTEIRKVLGLPLGERPKRPRLTVTLAAQDYEALSKRFGIPADDRLAIKEAATKELIAFHKALTSTSTRKAP